MRPPKNLIAKVTVTMSFRNEKKKKSFPPVIKKKWVLCLKKMQTFTENDKYTKGIQY